MVLKGQKIDIAHGTKDLDENGEPWQRELLPFLKDPNTRIGFWNLIKDNMGKELSKISLPVYLNEPTSIL